MKSVKFPDSSDSNFSRHNPADPGRIVISDGFIPMGGFSEVLSFRYLDVMIYHSPQANFQLPSGGGSRYTHI